MVIAMVFAAMPAFAGDTEDGNRFYENRDYARAISSFRRAAEQGQAAAQYKLGVMYRLGQGTAKDYRQAAYWYEKAAARGNGFSLRKRTASNLFRYAPRRQRRGETGSRNSISA